jgi:uncharacterized membrane protein
MVSYSSDKSDRILVILMVIVCVGLIMLPTGFEDRLPSNSLHCKARVISVDNTRLRSNLIIKSGSQNVDVEILDGPFAGKTVSVFNNVVGKLDVDEIFASGHIILVELSVKPDGSIAAGVSRGRYRLDISLLLMGLFALGLVAVAGYTGLKALLSFVFAVLIIWKVLFPFYLNGWNPIPLTVCITSVLLGATCFLVGGLGRKGLAAFLGSFMGVLLTCGLAMLFTRRFAINGAVAPFAETLLYSGFHNLNLSQIFISGIFLASSGALMDVSMDIAASMDEIVSKRPDIGLREHIRSGMTVGRAVVGTMTTTLLLAYSGSSSAMLMFFMGQGVPMANMFNFNHVSAEVLKTLVGSFGLVTVAPFTAVAGGLIYHYRRGIEPVGLAGPDPALCEKAEKPT